MSRVRSQRNASIIEMRRSGRSYAFLARELSVSRDRVRQIVELARREEKRRGELVARYGNRPNISALPDDTPIDVLELCDGRTHGWAVRVGHLKWSEESPMRTLGDLRHATDAQLRKERNVGKRMVEELRRFCPRIDSQQELVDRASTRKVAGRALAHLGRAFAIIEELQRADIAALPSPAPALQDTRAELEKAIALVEELRR
jgi:hypothetical protein